MKHVMAQIFKEDTPEQQRRCIENLAANGGKFRMIGKIVKTSKKQTKTGATVSTVRGIKGIFLFDIVNKVIFNLDKTLINEYYSRGILTDVRVEGSYISPKYDSLHAFPQYTGVNVLLDFPDGLPNVLVSTLNSQNEPSLFMIVQPGGNIEISGKNNVGVIDVMTREEVIDKFACTYMPEFLVNARVSKEKKEITINKPRWTK